MSDKKGEMREKKTLAEKRPPPGAILCEGCVKTAYANFLRHRNGRFNTRCFQMRGQQVCG